MRTTYRVYEIGEVEQHLPGLDDGDIESSSPNGRHKLVYMGETEASGGRQAVARVVSEPRENTEYAAIPVRNITTYTPRFKPATVSWS